MKGNITVSIDIGLIEQLKKETNYSELINKITQEHYEVGRSKNLAILNEIFDKKRQEMKKLRKEIKEIRGEIAQINKKEKEILNVFKNLDPDQKKRLEELEFFSMTWWRYNRKDFKGFTFEEISKIYRELKGGI
jgi:hypothetical protein